MQYWLMKSEPDVWSIDQQKKAGTKGAPWDGVRNYQAAKNLKSMKRGDLCFFYHSNIGKEIVGIVEVIKEAYLDKTDKSGRFVAVTVKFKNKLPKPVTLENIKNINEVAKKPKIVPEIKKTIPNKWMFFLPNLSAKLPAGNKIAVTVNKWIITSQETWWIGVLNDTEISFSEISIAPILVTLTNSERATARNAIHL